MVKKCLLGTLTVILFIIIYSCSQTEKKEGGQGNLVIKDVIEKPTKISDRYVSLGRMYKYIDYGGIEFPDLYIDKRSGLSIPAEQIESCSVQDVVFHPEGLLVYQVAFKFDKKLSSTLKDFFKPRVGKTVAILLEDKTVFTVGDLREMVDVQFTATVFGRSKSQIKDELTIVCNNVK